MKDHRIYWAIALLAFALAQPLACVSPSKSVRVGPTSAPTVELVPDISGAILMVKDMPPGFEALSAAERAKYKMTEEDLARTFPLGFQARPANLFAFLNTDPENFAIVFGGLAYPLSTQDIASFDSTFAKSDNVLKIFVTREAANAKITTLESSGMLPGINKYGERSFGFYIVGKQQSDIRIRGESAFFTRGKVLAAISSAGYTDQTHAPPRIIELIQILDSRIATALGK